MVDTTPTYGRVVAMSNTDNAYITTLANQIRAIRPELTDDAATNAARLTTDIRGILMANTAKAEILTDLRDGRFTADDITCFADLHDFVDANEYGDIPCEDPDEMCAVGNAMQDTLDHWIKAGGLLEAAAA